MQVVHFLVNSIQRGLQQHLIRDLYRESCFASLLQEVFPLFFPCSFPFIRVVSSLQSSGCFPLPGPMLRHRCPAAIMTCSMNAPLIMDLRPAPPAKQVPELAESRKRTRDRLAALNLAIEAMGDIPEQIKMMNER